jgi:hypothetical protein
MQNFNLMHWFRKHQNIILLATVGGFIISTFVGFGLYVGFGSSASDAVLEVNGQSVPYHEYQMLYNRVVNNQRDQGQQLTPEVLSQIKQQIIQSLVQELVFSQEAKRYNLEVTDSELAGSLASIPAFQKSGKFDPQSYIQALQFNLRTTPEEFEKAQKGQLLINRLRNFVVGGIKVSDQQLDMEFNQYVRTLKGKDRQDAINKFQKNKEEFRERIRQEEISQVLNRWYQQLGTNLKVKVNLDDIEKRLTR